jgi:hypothetical protein
MNTAAPSLRIITDPNAKNAAGEPIQPFTLSYDPSGILHVRMSIGNFGDAPWNSGDPVLHPDFYNVIDGKFMLKNGLEIIVKGQGGEIKKVRPILCDAGETMRMSEFSGPPANEPFFRGFVISPGYYNATTENNIYAIDGPAGDIVLGPLPDGRYSVDVIIDPDNATNSRVVESGFFDAVSQIALMRTALKIKGPK